MRHNFEAASSTLIEVDPYNRFQKLLFGPGRKANKYGVEFSYRRGSYGVGLHWNKPKELKKISKDQKYELVDWMHDNDGKELIKA